MALILNSPQFQSFYSKASPKNHQLLRQVQKAVDSPTARRLTLGKENDPSYNSKNAIEELQQALIFSNETLEKCSRALTTRKNP